MVIASIQHHAKVRQHGRWQQLDALENSIKRNTANSVSKKKLKKNIIEQKKNLRKKITANGPIDLGTMLLEFLEFYGRALDINVVGISVRGQGTLYRKNTKSFYNPNRKLGKICCFVCRPLHVTHWLLHFCFCFDCCPKVHIY